MIKTPEQSTNSPEQRIIDGIIGTAQLLLDESPNTRETGMLGFTRQSAEFTLQEAAYIPIGNGTPIKFSKVDVATGLMRPGELSRSVSLTFSDPEIESNSSKLVDVSRGELHVTDGQDIEGDFCTRLDTGAAEVFLASFDDLATRLL